MVFKLVVAAPRTWRRLEGENRSPTLVAGVTATDGVATAAPDHRAARSDPSPKFGHSSGSGGVVLSGSTAQSPIRASMGFEMQMARRRSTISGGSKPWR